MENRTQFGAPVSDRLQELRARIDQGLADYLALSPGCPASLREAMGYSLLAPGKRFRPLLTLLAAEACEGTIEAALPAACAVEMVHAYSLVHDDLPAMDNDDFRRGRPTCHKQFSEGLAILVGDALLTLAFDLLARHVHPWEQAGRCCAVLAEAAGACQLVGGQADDIAPDKGNWTLAHLESIHSRKTGALIVAALQLGAVTAGAHEEELNALETFGRCTGLAFQIADDLLDLTGDAHEPGSVPHRDQELGKLTFPALLGVADSVRRLELLVDQAGRALLPFGPRAAALEFLAQSVLHRVREAEVAACHS